MAHPWPPPYRTWKSKRAWLRAKVRALHPSSRAWPRVLAFLVVLSLAFGADAPDNYKQYTPTWLKYLWPKPAHAAAGGTVGPFTYTGRSQPFSETLGGIPSRCVAYVSHRRVVVVCVPRKTAPKA